MNIGAEMCHFGQHKGVCRKAAAGLFGMRLRSLPKPFCFVRAVSTLQTQVSVLRICGQRPLKSMPTWSNPEWSNPEQPQTAYWIFRFRSPVMQLPRALLEGSFTAAVTCSNLCSGAVLLPRMRMLMLPSPQILSEFQYDGTRPSQAQQKRPKSIVAGEGVAERQGAARAAVTCTCGISLHSIAPLLLCHRVQHSLDEL